MRALGLASLITLAVAAPAIANQTSEPATITGVISQKVIKVYRTKRQGVAMVKKPVVSASAIGLINRNKPLTIEPLHRGETQLKAVSITPLRAISTNPLKVIVLNPLKAASTNSLKAVPQLGLTTVTNQDAGVSPLGQWFGSSFSWVDRIFNLKPVKPWQKATLAEPAMAASGVSPVVAKFANKVFISKEATLGGNGVAGGGCGCK